MRGGRGDRFRTRVPQPNGTRKKNARTRYANQVIHESKRLHRP